MDNINEIVVIPAFFRQLTEFVLDLQKVFEENETETIDFIDHIESLKTIEQKLGIIEEYINYYSEEMINKVYNRDGTVFNKEMKPFGDKYIDISNVFNRPDTSDGSKREIFNYLKSLYSISKYCQFIKKPNFVPVKFCPEETPEPESNLLKSLIEDTQTELESFMKDNPGMKSEDIVTSIFNGKCGNTNDLITNVTENVKKKINGKDIDVDQLSIEAIEMFKSFNVGSLLNSMLGNQDGKDFDGLLDIGTLLKGSPGAKANSGIDVSKILSMIGGCKDGTGANLGKIFSMLGKNVGGSDESMPNLEEIEKKIKEMKKDKKGKKKCKSKTKAHRK